MYSSLLANFEKHQTRMPYNYFDFSFVHNFHIVP